MKKLMMAVGACVCALGAMAANTFRVTPYVQHPAPTAMTIMWLAQEGGGATIEYGESGSEARTTLSATERADLSANLVGQRFGETVDALEYCQAPELDYDYNPSGSQETLSRYNAWEMPYTRPYQYRVRLTGLKPDTVYAYTVTLTGGASYSKTFRTPPTADAATWKPFKFIYYSDSETEPRDNDPVQGLTSDWTEPGTSNSRTYYATQTEAYRQNVKAAVDFGTDLIVMAGDLAQTGSKQCDWDEFWRHNAGPLNDPAGSIPILAAPGNHDYTEYADGGEKGMGKFLSYFEFEPNGAAVDDDQLERFHRVDYGPCAFIFLDANNGDDSDISKDTNCWIDRGQNGCHAPDFNPGSAQYQWLEAQLKDAQKTRAFTFIVSHQCPFSVGYHGRENTYHPSSDPDGEALSGRPLRILLPLMHKYGVDAWFAGHDEMMERSVTTGTETLPDGTEVEHSFSVWDMGIAGDGLRGNLMAENPYEAFRADKDAPEAYEDGVLVSGGKHYGHLQVSIDKDEQGLWRATFDPIYLFYSKQKDGTVSFGGVRHYDDQQVRVSTRVAAAPAEDPTHAIYVTQEGAGRMDGSDWANAFGSLQAALAVATEEGDEIRVKQGDYTMTAETTIASHPGLTIRGGYTGEGETREGRSNFLRDAASPDYFRLFDVTGSTVAFDGIGFLNGKFNVDASGALGLAVCLKTSCNATFTNCLFRNNGLVKLENNSNSVYGGALYTDGGTLAIADCEFDSNYITYSGSNNHSGLGGALYAKSAALSVVRTRFVKNYNNTAHNRATGGGAIAINACNNALIDSCRFETNTVYRGNYNSSLTDLSSGGTIHVASSSGVTIRDCEIIGSHVSNGHYTPGDPLYCFGCGQMIFFKDSSASVVRTVLYNRDYPANNSTSSLVDFYCSGTTSGTLALTNVLMVAGAQGCCLGCYGDNAVVDALNCTLTGVRTVAQRTNTGYSQFSGTATFRNCLFWDNVDGAIYVLKGAEPQLVNCTTDVDPLWGDTTYCHPASRAGRYDGGWFAGGEWVTTDEATSPTVDAGVPTMSVGAEPQPNGRLVNIGYDGGTEVASKADLGSDPVVTDDVLKVFAYPATGIGADGATVKADVASTGGGADPTVTVVWDTADRGASSVGAWGNSATLDGTFAPWDLASYAITGATGPTVYYRVVASNEKGSAWSDPVKTFKLGSRPTIAYGDVRRIFRTTAQPTAILTDDGESETVLKLAWWPTDDPTQAVTNEYNAGEAVAVGTTVDWTLTGLAPGASYTYQVIAVNVTGETVLDAQTFTTRTDDAAVFCVGPEAGLGDGSSWANAADFVRTFANATGTNDEIRLLAGDYLINDTITLADHGGLVLRGGYTGEGEAREGRSVFYRSTLGLEFRLFEVTASTVTFDGVGFKDGTLGTSGALGQAVRLQSSCTAVFTNCLFKNNGYNYNNCNAKTMGGAIYTSGGSLTVDGCTFEDNSVFFSGGGNVLGWGGAIYATGAAVTIRDTGLYRSRTGTAHNRYLGGGALAFFSCPTVLIDGCVFEGNYTYRTTYTPTLTDSAFGGSAYMESCPSVIVRNCVVKNGYTQNSSLAAADLAYAGCGHEFYLYKCAAEISRTVFYSRGLAAKNAYSGLVDVRDTTLALTNVLMVAGDQGWCLGTHGASTVEAVNCTFTGVKQPDVATRPGAAFSQSAGSATFRNCIFWDNFAGAWAKYDGNDPTLVDCMTSTDPQWGDEVFCHPISRAGRYDGGWFTNGTWVATDEATSPAVDRIPGFAKLATEPQPNGCHVNAGYDGNTEVASKSALGTNPVVTEGTLAVFAYPDTRESPDGVTVYGDVAALSAGETAADVWLVYDSEDRGTSAKEDWAHVVPCGAYEPWALVTADISSFVGKVYYRFVAQDGQATAWSDPVREFVRAARPTVAYDTDAHPFTHVYRTSARVHFELVSDGGAAATAWATVAPTEDPAAAVDFPVGEGTLAAGKYAAVMTGLNPGTEYTVTVTVRNSVGDAVTEPKTFTTPAVETKMSVCVAPTAAGYGDGTGWANATTLTDAITAVALGNGDEILLQSGTYAMFGFVLNQMTNLTVRGGYDASGTPYAGETVLTTEGLLTPTTDKRFFIAHHSKVTLDNLTFTKGTNLDGSDLFGQALGVKDNSDVTVTNCVFRQNGLDSATGFEFTSFYGGAIAVSGGRLTVADSTFSGNRLMGGGQNMQPYGGAISATGNAVVSVTGCTFDQNHVQMVHARAGGGGALFFGSGVQATVESCLFTTNYGRTSSGGDIYEPQDGYGPYGGAIYAGAATLRLKDLRIVGGWAANGSYRANGFDRGGTFYFAGGTVSGEKIAIYDAGANGYADSVKAGYLASGAIAVNGGTVALTNVLHAGSRHGACVAHMGGTLELVNGTVVDAKGSATSPMSGYLQYTRATSGAATMKNCIFWNNKGGFRCFTNDVMTLDVSYSDIEGEADAAKHVISADPLLYAPTKARAYHLRAGSPCAGTGDATGWPADATDLDGKPRTRGSTIDMGCYSYNVPGFMLMLK